jgi:HK97 family phage prohead protease
MPYFITDQADGCDGWATVKDDGEVIGCHMTKDDAIAQMVAVSLAEGMEPGGERGLPDNYRLALLLSVPPSRACGNCAFYNSTRMDGIRGYCEKWDDYADSVGYCNAWQPVGADAETNQEDEPISEDDMEIVVSDIDGTLADNGRPRPAMVAHLQAKAADGYAIIIVTGRLENQRQATERLLADAGVPYVELIMSPGGDPVAFKTGVAADLMAQFEIEEWWENDPETVAALTAMGIEVGNPDEYRDQVTERRAINVPDWMQANARRGIEWYEAWHGGDGLTARTVREAREMAAGQISDEKAVRMAAWFARHMGDLDGTDRDTDPPTPGMVAHALWGGWPVDESRRAQTWAENKVAEMNGTERTQMTTVETRQVTVKEFEVRETADGMTFTGYAAVFDSPSEDMGFIEYVRKGAFTKTLRARNNIMLLWSHDTAQPLASTRSKTLRLSEDAHGLRVEADLPNTTLGRDVAELLRTGVIQGMSFGFSVPRRGDKWSDDGMSRELLEVRLHEVSIVAFPAYSKTSASVRSLDVVANRTGANVSELTAALDALEAGDDLTRDQAALLTNVVNSLTPADNVMGEDVQTKLAMMKHMLDLSLKSV